MIPLGDDLPTLRRPWMTWTILAVTWAVWLVVQGAGASPAQLAKTVCNLGLVPGELTHRVPVGVYVPLGDGMVCVVDNDPINIFTPVISIFLHGGWGHILGNSLYFWIFGNNVEDSMGPWRFLLFYLVCGVVAAASHVYLNPTSPVPTVGASGAISGVLGAYLVLYPRSRVRMFIPPFFIFPIYAVFVLLFWFGSQLLAGLPQLTPMRPDVSGGVAVWAHVGGFIAGVLLIKLFANPRYVAAHRQALSGHYGHTGWGPGA